MHRHQRVPRPSHQRNNEPAATALTSDGDTDYENSSVRDDDAIAMIPSPLVSQMLYDVGHEVFRSEDVQEVDVSGCQYNSDAVPQVLDRSGRKESRKSPVWKYFVVEGGSAKCQLCEKMIKRSGGNTSNLMAHLRSSHRGEYDGVIEKVARRKSAAMPVKWVCDICHCHICDICYCHMVRQYYKSYAV